MIELQIAFTFIMSSLSIFILITESIKTMSRLIFEILDFSWHGGCFKTIDKIVLHRFSSRAYPNRLTYTLHSYIGSSIQKLKEFE